MRSMVAGDIVDTNAKSLSDSCGCAPHRPNEIHKAVVMVFLLSPCPSKFYLGTASLDPVITVFAQRSKDSDGVLAIVTICVAKLVKNK